MFPNKLSDGGQSLGKQWQWGFELELNNGQLNKIQIKFKWKKKAESGGSFVQGKVKGNQPSI